MKGVCQHRSKRHLHRYLAEFDFRYNERKIEDGERADRMLAGIVGIRACGRGSSSAMTSHDASPFHGQNRSSHR